jgi:hypothetical protein
MLDNLQVVQLKIGTVQITEVEVIIPGTIKIILNSLDQYPNKILSLQIMLLKALVELMVVRCMIDYMVAIRVNHPTP